jgi:hypothetical protein
MPPPALAPMLIKIYFRIPNAQPTHSSTSTEVLNHLHLHCHLSSELQTIPPNLTFKN